MSDDDHTEVPDDGDDPVLAAAGERLRARSRAVSPAAVETAVLRRRTRRLGALAAAAVVCAAVLGALVVVDRDGSDDDVELASPPGAPAPEEVERILAGLDDQPVDPTQVELVSTVSTFADCEGLIGELRRVGAEHVGSRGFGASYGMFEPWSQVSEEGDFAVAREASAPTANVAADEGGDAGVTLGTNVQVAGVDELDFVKAEGTLVYDLDGGALRITDVRSREVLARLDVTPDTDGDDDGEPTQANEILVADGHVVVFGTEYEVSDPVEGDPSATQATTEQMTLTFVDATDPAAPAITDRIRLEGSLVSARLVEGEIRLVTTSNMADLGFVMPTTPTSVAKALETNRRSVAGSAAADWIPDWQRDGEGPEPLVPCDRVHVPDTFAGVAMTSMVTFPLAAAGFEPAATSFLAPATTLYAGLEKVAISSEVWVDPIDRGELEFDDWQTAVHEFAFSDDDPPSYVGSGIVDGSTVGQFAFGEIGDSLAVVTTEGTPWQQDPDVAIDLTVLTPDGEEHLEQTSQVEDLSDGLGAVEAVRFVPGRVLVSTGFFGRQVLVVDVSVPAAPRRAGSVSVPGAVGYFHPLPDGRALLVGNRSDTVGEGDDERHRSWVQAHLLDVSDPDAPTVVQTWERPWTSDEVGGDHHAFTYWPDRQLAMWGLFSDEPGDDGLNEAIVLSTEGGLGEVAVPPANKPDEEPAPCPTVEVTDPEARQMIGGGAVVLHCAEEDVPRPRWPRYECYEPDEGSLALFVPEDQRAGTWFVCSPAGAPTVRRVLVVDGTPFLLTEQTLEALDPETFASTSITYHPSGGW